MLVDNTCLLLIAGLSLIQRQETANNLSRPIPGLIQGSMFGLGLLANDAYSHSRTQSRTDMGHICSEKK